MKKETIKYIIQLIVAVLTAIGSTLSVTTAASGAPAEGVALLGGTIVGTGWGECAPALSTSKRRGRPYCYPPSEGLGEVVCPNKNGSLRSKSFKNNK